MTQTPWPKAVTLDVAREVRRYRKMRHMTTERLAARCTELGSPIHRSVLANLESGRRENITVTDLVTLGRALGIPPLLLLYPVGRADACEVMPGKFLVPWEAAKLFTGELADDDDSAAADDLALFRRHDWLVRRWERGPLISPLADEQGDGMTEVEGALITLRTLMRHRELMPPELPPALAAVLPPEM